MNKNELSLNYIAQKKSLPMEQKLILTQKRIEEWYVYWGGSVYVSFSGGLDSTVLLDIVRKKYKDVPAVFIDTGLEFPEIRDFVKTKDNVIWLKPKLTFKEVIEKYGYPIISKEQSLYIEEARNTKSEKLRNLRLNGNSNGSFKISNKWKFMIEAPFDISPKCCDILKKNPAKNYEKESGNKAIVGSRISEGSLRSSAYLQTGCNAFNTKRPVSKPLSLWNDKDIKEYIEKENIAYSTIYDMGYERTGCMFCMFGIQTEKPGKTRFDVMKKTHPQQYNYCMEKLGCRKIYEYVMNKGDCSKTLFEKCC